MRDDERLFSFGVQLIVLTLILVAIFHAAFSRDEKELAQKNRTIVSLGQELANAKARFSALVQPEVLRPIVTRIEPVARPVGTGRTIGAKNMEPAQ